MEYNLIKINIRPRNTLLWIQDRQTDISNNLEMLWKAKSNDYNKVTKNMVERLSKIIKIDEESIEKLWNNGNIEQENYNNAKKIIASNQEKVSNLLSVVIEITKQKDSKISTKLNEIYIKETIRSARNMIQIYEWSSLEIIWKNYNKIETMIKDMKRIYTLIDITIGDNKTIKNKQPLEILLGIIQTEIDKLNQIVETYEDESSNEDYANDE